MVSRKRRAAQIESSRKGVASIRARCDMEASCSSSQENEASRASTSQCSSPKNLKMENVTILPKTLKLIHDDPKSQVIVSIQFEIEDTKKKISAAILNFNISKKANNAIRSERKRIVATILKTRKHVERFRRLWKKEKKKKEHSEILYKKSQLSKQETIAKFPPMFR
ncbi:Ribosomal protein L29 [Caenorhabditis elegans]|uniref:Ribosomal protein L29 n=1 Tax=Caenorhabditis elegans TaxID=6239 RepID=Q9N5Y0_CAEEL|nr:Ribosomal protein L29 [Caenorhabditis elegans]CCD64619.1 Ribosomal protein L29 [Caenorhabditis elegans]|eukprot:NP_495432.1 Uncharacterized protein CELE_C15F1.8 [Caenorhabditis elegans]